MKLETVGENLLPAIAYGDACGLPFEAQLAQPVNSITALPSIEHNAFLDIPDELKGERGIWSDDTHLSLAVMISLIRTGDFSLEDVAAAHVSALDHVKGANYEPDFIPAVVTDSRNNGFGGATTESINRLADGVDPHESGKNSGSGNGVLMKMAGLVYWQCVRRTPSAQSRAQIVEFTRMTHDSPVAVVSSLVHQEVLKTLLLQDTYEPKQQQPDFHRLLDSAMTSAVRLERLLDNEARTSGVLNRLTGKTLDSREVILNAVEGKKGGGFYAPETLMMAYGSFTLEPHFPDCVYRAVELGGDADSIGSIVAGMAACYWGTELEFPADIEEVFAINRLRRISKDLTKLAVGEGV